MVNNKIILLIVIPLIVIMSFIIFSNISEHTELGANNKGKATKDVYSHYGPSNIKIAVVTGMHPREDLATKLVPQVVKVFAVFNPVEIINYQITVTDNPQDFDISRSNGEALAAQYVVPDAINSNYQLVIIAHDHEKGYGEGYYIATPTRDDKSIQLGEALHQLLPSFNFYPGSSKTKKHSSSVILVDKPLSNAGIPVFVYEMPEWHSVLEAFPMTYQLFSTSVKILRAN